MIGNLGCARSLDIWWRHATASVTRPAISRCSHTTRYIVNLSTVNYGPSERQVYNGYQGKRILTSTAAVKASFHEPEVSINLAHSFMSFRASSGAPMPIRALLRFISRFCGLEGSNDSAAVYCETALSYCLAFRALSPRSSSLPRHRDLKSDRGWSG